MLHRTLGAVMALVIAVTAGLAALAWVLAHRPIDVPWLTHRLEAEASSAMGPGAVSIQSTQIAWAGFHEGLHSPIVVRLNGLRLRTESGDNQATIPNAELTFALLPLLHGRLEPRAVRLEAPRLQLTRQADGTFGFERAASKDQGRLPPLAGQDGGGVEHQRNQSWGGVLTLEELRWVHVLDGSINIDDRRLASTWRASHVTLNLERGHDGRIDGRASGQVALGDARTQVAAAGMLTPQQSRLHAAFSPVPTAALARALPTLAGLGGLDASIGGTMDLALSPELRWQQASVKLQAGAGKLRLGDSPLSLLGGTLLAEATPERLVVTRMMVKLQDAASGVPAVLLGHGMLRRSANAVQADLALGLDRLPFAALSALWPSGVAKDPRTWVTQNITDGTARDAHIDLSLTADPGMSRIDLTHASGSATGDDVTVRWLGQVPPIKHAQTNLRVVDPDHLEVTATSGEVVPDAPHAGPLVIRNARVDITGLAQKDQFATIDGRVTGSVPDVLALLRDKRLHLLSDHPIDLEEPEGAVDANLSVHIPLIDKLTVDDVPITAKARLSDVHLSNVALGWDLDSALFGLTVTPDQLVADGSGQLAGMPVQLGVKMDFRAAPPGQVVQEISVTGRPDTTALSAAGLDTGGLVSGPLPISVTYTERRGGVGAVALRTDLTTAVLAVSALGWQKPPGVQAELNARIRLDHGRLIAIDRIDAAGTGFSVQGNARFANDAITALTLDRVILGRSEARATVRFAPKGGAMVASITGRVLDLSPLFERSAGTPQPARPARRRRPWSLDARFGSVLLARGHALSGVSMHASDDGLLLREVTLKAATGQHESAQLAIRPHLEGRHMTAEATNAGALLQALGLPGVIGGKLTMQGDWNGWREDTPLVGTLGMTNFRVRKAPTLGKLLQAVTLYGLAQALAGPGVGFDKLTAPFRYELGLLQVKDAHASSTSLGITAAGHVNADTDWIDVRGTVVPLYAVNTMLGRLPIVGRLFSPERNGGLIAANYTVKGDLNDPAVSVNPLSVLTPGALRGLFGR